MKEASGETTIGGVLKFVWVTVEGLSLETLCARDRLDRGEMGCPDDGLDIIMILYQLELQDRSKTLGAVSATLNAVGGRERSIV